MSSAPRAHARTHEKTHLEHEALARPVEARVVAPRLGGVRAKHGAAGVAHEQQRGRHLRARVRACWRVCAGAVFGGRLGRAGG
jgi:hypothetical protein